MGYALAQLAPEYARFFKSMKIVDSEVTDFNVIAKRLLAHMVLYKQVEAATGVPASLIAVIHNREADGNFACHLHNGDPLSARTVHVPAGRPPNGVPPFTWVESAIDALTIEGFTSWKNWTVELVCFALERYNGYGYRDYFAAHGQDHAEPSPYLWAGTNIQEPGKYIADGKFNRSAYDTQLGAVPLLVSLWQLDRSLALPLASDGSYTVPAPRPAPAPLPPNVRPPPPVPPAPPAATVAVAAGSLIGALSQFAQLHPVISVIAAVAVGAVTYHLMTRNR